jgi:two-component system OmpR family response regulator
MRILFVEDEPQLAQQVARALTRAGHDVQTLHDGAAGYQVASSNGHDLILLDVNLPNMDGFTVLKKLREQKNYTRVLLLTARGEVGDRVTGLRAGADDYLTKPFAMDELLARIDALGRRTRTPNDETLLEVGDLRMDVIHRKISKGGQPIALSPREFELLQIFMQEPGRTFSREEICERIWEREHEYDTRTVEIFIMRLRKKIDQGNPRPMIETVRGVGYVLRVPR